MKHLIRIKDIFLEKRNLIFIISMTWERMEFEMVFLFCLEGNSDFFSPENSEIMHHFKNKKIFILFKTTKEAMIY